MYHFLLIDISFCFRIRSESKNKKYYRSVFCWYDEFVIHYELLKTSPKFDFNNLVLTTIDHLIFWLMTVRPCSLPGSCLCIHCAEFNILSLFDRMRFWMMPLALC